MSTFKVMGGGRSQGNNYAPEIDITGAVSGRKQVQQVRALCRDATFPDGTTGG